MKLSVIIPAYNESKRIEKTLRSVDSYLAQKSFDYEILVVDDGSRDNTVSLCKILSGTVRNLRVVANKENHGKGWVVKQGMLEAKGDIRLFMDADNSTTLDQFEKMLPYFEKGAEAVIGSRRIEGSNIAVHQPFFRDFLGGAFRFIVHTLVPLGVTDSQCGFKAFSAKATENIFPKQRIFRWAFDVEVLALAKRSGIKIYEIPVTWINDAESHVKFSGMLMMLLEILQIRLNLWFGKYDK